MKKYIKPDLDAVRYSSEDCLIISTPISKNGEDSIEINYHSSWDDGII